MQVTVRYDEVKARRTHRGRCPICRKPVRRVLVATETVNPFNRGPDGKPKTYAQVVASVEAKADQLVPDFTHYGCRVWT